MTVNDQFEYWNDPAVAADLRAGTTGVSDFAKRVATTLPEHARVLELGCGAGDDAAYFAEKRHSVVGLDFSFPLVEMASQRFANFHNLRFRQTDITRPLDVGAESCDAVYARMSLHYFDDETTANVFSEVFWVLRPAGRFHFMCLSTEDPRYGKGTNVGPDMFELDGEVRHFFEPDYALDLLEDTGFMNVQCTPGADRIYGEPTGYLECSGAKGS